MSEDLLFYEGLRIFNELGGNLSIERLTAGQRAVVTLVPPNALSVEEVKKVMDEHGFVYKGTEEDVKIGGWGGGPPSHVEGHVALVFEKKLFDITIRAEAVYEKKRNGKLKFTKIVLRASDGWSEWSQ